MMKFKRITPQTLLPLSEWLGDFWNELLWNTFLEELDDYDFEI